MIYDGCITLNYAVHGQVATVSCVSDLSVFENFHGHFGGV